LKPFRLNCIVSETVEQVWTHPVRYCNSTRFIMQDALWTRPYSVTTGSNIKLLAAGDEVRLSGSPHYTPVLAAYAVRVILSL